jgi:hypothetical protein
MLAVGNWMFSNDPSYLSTAIEIVKGMATMHKHPGFKEEDEYRIVARPLFQHLYKKVSDGPKRVPISFYTRSGLIVPHIKLFEPRLPIKRVIVGPHPDAVKRKESVDMLLKEKGIYQHSA